MRKQPPEAIINYLKRLDRCLTRPVELEVIGGTAIALRWCKTYVTLDIDIINVSLPEELQRAVDEAGAEGRVPISFVTVSSQPYDYDTRLEQFEIPGLRHLTVLLPEAHDLALMKIARCEAHDVASVVEMHRVSPLSLETLIERYRKTDHIGSERTFRTSFLLVVRELFGQAAAAHAKDIL